MTFLPSFFKVLNSKYNYAVLRGYNNLPDKFDSHDIDLLIEEKSYKRIISSLKVLANEVEYNILMINRNDRFATVILAKVIEGKVDFLFIDLFFNYSLFGVHFFSAKRILEHREFNGKVYHVNMVYEFLEKFLNTSFLNAKYPAKYNYIKSAIEKNHRDYINNELNKLFFKKVDLEYYFKKPFGSKKLARVFILNMFRKPYKQTVQLLKFIFYQLHSSLYPRGISLSFTGPDGSGKTTVLEGVKKELSKIYREVELFHFRPNVIPRIAELFNKAGLKKEVDTNYDQPHRGQKQGKLSSFIRLSYYIPDYILGYYKQVKPVLKRRGVVIFDRYYTDIITDSRRSMISLNYKLIFGMRRLVPAMQYNFVFYVNPKIILERKQELSQDQIAVIYSKLEYICKNDRKYIPVENNGTPEEAITKVLELIMKVQNNKYTK